jgi:uncharacterized protein YraI
MITRSIALIVFLTGLFFAASAFAANGYATANVNMRTGPGVYYPRITVIAAGSAVSIYDCTHGHRWCSVGWRGYRGWVSGRYLRFIGYRPRIYAPPDIYFDFDFREPRWRDRHDRWHKARPYPRRKKRIIRRDWNRDHDRWHKKSRKHKAKPYPRRKKKIIRRDWNRDRDHWQKKQRKHKSTPYPRRKKKIIRRDWNRDHDRWHKDNRGSGKRIIRQRKCPPNRDCD